MKIVLGILLTLFLNASCNNVKQNDASDSAFTEYDDVVTDNYELSKPISNSNTVLILFGGFPENSETIKREFKVMTFAQEKNVAVLYMNYNQKLWMSKEDKRALKEKVETIFVTNELSPKDVYIGGFSSGGNITLLLSDYLIASKSSIQPKGIFIIDSPVDLLELYRLSERNLDRNFSEGSIQEATWLIDVFKSEFGKPEDGIKSYESFSPYTSETGNISNLSNLDGLKIRFYSEPDTIWWQENRNNEPTDLNAHWIEKLATQLKQELTNSSVEYITTENKGYRSNGDRHPHSWSIVDEKDLINWITIK